MNVEELRDVIARAIRGEPMRGEPSWELLNAARKEAYIDDADRVLAALESAQAQDVLRQRAELHADFDAWEIHNRWQDFGAFMFQAGVSHEVRNAVLTETYDFLTKLTKWVTKPDSPDNIAHAPDKSGHENVSSTTIAAKETEHGS